MIILSHDHQNRELWLNGAMFLTVRPGRSVLTEPIGLVLRFLKNFGSWKTGTVRFFSKLRTEKLRVRLKKEPNFQDVQKNSPFNSKF